MANKILVDAITLSRILLSVLVIACILKYPDSILLITGLFAVIFLSDFTDGKLARRLSAASRTGAVMDVFADLFYIVTLCFTLALQGVFPAWMLAVIIGKFIEFWCTSAIAKREGRCQKSGLLFDRLGRIAAALYYILPLLTVLLDHYLLRAQAVFTVNMICLSVTLVTIISSFHRVKNLLGNQKEKCVSQVNAVFAKCFCKQCIFFITRVNQKYVRFVRNIK